MQDQIEILIKDVVCELTEDWDLDGLVFTEDTKLCAEAGFESLDIVQLVVLIDKKLNNPVVIIPGHITGTITYPNALY